MKKLIKYEVQIIGYCDSFNGGDQLKEAQEDGWEIAGEIKVTDSFHDMTFAKIPMKRKI